MVTPAQVRAARALLGIRQADLAERAGVAVITVKMFERGSGDPRLSTVKKIKKELEASGIEFVPGGARFGAAE